MSEVKYTPGPWFVGGFIQDEEDPDSHPEWIVQRETPKGELNISAVIYMPRDEEHKANALLIAAAPELLEALQLLDEAYCNVGQSMSRCDRANGRKALIAARAAIAKALGEA